ncbi:TetR family transcriptional regulator [Clostridium carboxidivorans P7]|uniref:Transcriptional regulator, TetR family n=1 Tax=Clostridium carboxidivorans P7 TaxID=536227 RepID=C6PR76_9CLOT|nr:TetR/AcrR family transcriptional regulator [Clostridium carboxidivorans]AKN29526.1 TetR family transcriptional regulator [Clostridium carboxidivorans P7]EET88300.1 transcriptional regulator, TetR family [Clostridium carboxidivorans P7]EFG89548.1 transcriptional regulator, TetR family [Clostridium carboxidivorans P7]
MSSRKKMTSRELQAIERKQQLLKTSKKLFAQNGYCSTSVRSITKSIGMADGLIYHYFPNGKMQILKSLFKEGNETLDKHLCETLKGIKDEMTLREVMIYLGNNFKENYRKDDEFASIIFREKDLLEDDDVDFLSEIFKKQLNILADFFKKRAEKGEMKKLDFEMVAYQFMSTIITLVMMEYMGIHHICEQNDVDDIEKVVDFMLNLWV